MLKQKIKTSFDKHVFLREPRNQRPLEDVSAVDELRVFSKWLLVVPLVLSLILSFGQLALLLKSEFHTSSSRSSLSAEYGPWEFFPVHGVSDGLIDDIRRDNIVNPSTGEMFEKPIIVTGQDWLKERSGAAAIEENLDILHPSPTPSPISLRPE
jgi:hypothetical protein